MAVEGRSHNFCGHAESRMQKDAESPFADSRARVVLEHISQQALTLPTSEHTLTHEICTLTTLFPQFIT